MSVSIRKNTCIILLVLLCMLFCQFVHAQEQKSFNTLQEVLDIAKQYNHTFENIEIQKKLSDLSQKTALGNALNPRIPASVQTLNNLQQQVIFLPGEVFGQPGTLKKITTGQQYSSVFNIQPQFDVLNLANFSQVKSAKINKELTAVKSKIEERQLYDQINAIYFNIISFHGQTEILKQNIAIADSIVQITQNRFNEGVGRKQDLNEAQVNLITLHDQLEQLHFNTRIQEESLALFFENSFIPVLTENVGVFENTAHSSPVNNMLEVQDARLQLSMAEQELRIARLQHLPSLSFVSSFSWQNLSNTGFFHSASSWIDYSYVGLKLSMDLPTTVSKLSAIRNKQFQRSLLKNTYEHSIREAETKNGQLSLDYEKALSQLLNLKKIAQLKEDTYLKNFQQYEENILSLDRLLIAHNDLLNARLNVVTALAAIGFNKSRIDINNKY